MAFYKFPRHLPKYKGLTREIVAQYLNYNPETGTLTWLKRSGSTRAINVWNARYAGKIAGRPGNHGYVDVGLKFGAVKHRYLAHILIWVLMTGELPKYCLDHRNVIKKDNCWSNLREATKAQNGHNRGLSKANTSGVRGVRYNKRKKKFIARIAYLGVEHCLGYYKTIEEATEARTRKAKDLYGEFFKC